jgi:hypothetical protein
MTINRLTFLSLLLVLSACTQVKLVQLELPREHTYEYSQVEPSIAINPNKPHEMIAGSVLSDYYFSKDGGKTWESKTLKSKYGVYGDPVMIFDNENRAYYFHLASVSFTRHLDRIVCQWDDELSGEFENESFTKPLGTKVQDKHWIVVDPNNNALYMTWTQFDAYDSDNPLDSSFIMFARSTDQGVSWTDPLRISKHGGDCLDGDNTVEGAVPAVDAKGNLVVTWTGPQGLVMQRSEDGGNTWLEEERSIEPQIGGWDYTVPGMYRANGLPILKCDLSGGPHHGNLYLNWSDQKNGTDDTDVWLLKSEDGGATWSERIRVNQDGTGRHQFFTWMTVDQKTGYLYFVYYDRRAHADAQTDVYVSVSRDGGLTFHDMKISDTPFVPSDEIFFGDYLNIDAVNGEIRPIYPRMDKGKISLWVALLNDAQLPK